MKFTPRPQPAQIPTGSFAHVAQAISSPPEEKPKPAARAPLSLAYFQIPLILFRLIALAFAGWLVLGGVELLATPEALRDALIPTMVSAAIAGFLLILRARKSREHDPLFDQFYMFLLMLLPSLFFEWRDPALFLALVAPLLAGYGAGAVVGTLIPLRPRS